MGDFTMMKLIICSLYRWNPYSDEVKKIPDFYWLVAFRTLMYKDHRVWEDLIRPHGELISSITAPENYSEYTKWKKAKEKEKESGALEVEVDGYTVAKANAHLDPEKGLVDADGNVIIPKEEFFKRSNLDGIMVTY